MTKTEYKAQRRLDRLNGTASKPLDHIGVMQTLQTKTFYRRLDSFSKKVNVHEKTFELLGISAKSDIDTE